MKLSSLPVLGKKYLLVDGEKFVTSIQVTKNICGCHANWWISSKERDSLQVVGTYSSPIYGEDVEEASRKAVALTPFVLELVEKTWDGYGVVVETPQSEDVAEHAKLHMQGHAASFEPDEMLERTFKFNSIAEYFGCYNHSQVVAEFEGIGVRTVNERVQRYRKMKEAELSR
jgi:hypothetical protein